MATEVFLHIGPPKTGTTYLQSILWSNRDRLKSQGLLVPGPSAVHHFHAAVDLMQRDPTGVGRDAAGAWPALIGRLGSWSERAVVSHENFGFASAEHVRRARADLADTDLHILFTARALTAVAPAAWQERLKNRSDASWANFMEELRSGEQPRPFWRQHGGPALLDWAEGLPRERVHVITVPPTGASPTLLWERFADVIGADPLSCEVDVPRSNESLGIDEAAYLRWFNAGPGRDLEWSTYRAGVKHGLAAALARRSGKRRILAQGVDAIALRTRAEGLQQQIRTCGFHVVGDLAELTDTDAERAPAQPNDEVAAESMRHTADAAVEGLVQGLAAQTRTSREDLATVQRQHAEQVRRLRANLDAAMARADNAEAKLDAATARADNAEARLELPLWRLGARRLADRSPRVRRWRKG